MKRVLAIFFSIFISGAALALTFDEIRTNLDPEKNTKIAIKEYWKSIKGTEVSWSGSVFDVKGGRGKYKVYLKVGSSVNPNVVLVTSDEKATGLKKNQSIKFKGRLANYKGWLGRLNIELIDGEILK